MRHWLVLAAIYMLVAALIVPGPLGAQEEAPVEVTAPAETPPAESPPVEPPLPTTPAEPPPVAPAPAPAPAEPAPVEPAPAPVEPAPAPAPAEPAPAEEPAAADSKPAVETRTRKLRRKPVAVAAATENVTITDFEFTPAEITIQQGDTVTWTNEGPTAHSATASDGSFDTGIFSAGGSRSETFDEAGTFSYICTPHPNMTGTIVVEASSSGEAGSGDSDSGSTGSGADSGSTGSGSGSGSSSSGSGLPPTGADALALAILGLVMLALGVAIQRHSNRSEAGAAGRIGW
jgi:plastocyanin